MTGASSRIGDATPETGQVKDGAKQAVGLAEENPIGLALGGVAAEQAVETARQQTQKSTGP